MIDLTSDLTWPEKIKYTSSTLNIISE